MKVAIVGATGAVGREMVLDLEASRLKNIDVGFFASPRSAGSSLSFRGHAHEVKAFELNALNGFDACLMSAGGNFSKQYAKAIADLGVMVIDNSSAWRMASDIPLIVPEVNGPLLKELSFARGKRGGIIANPNCSTIQMVVALKPLADQFGLDLVEVATYQSVSGTGQRGIRELSSQVEASFKFTDPEVQVYAQPIAFNVLPAIDVLDQSGHCFEEEKLIRETQKILNMPKLEILATSVRVPVYHCHCEAVTVRLRDEVTAQQAQKCLGAAPGIVCYNDHGHGTFPTPRTVVGQPQVHVARVRTPLGSEKSRWLQFWVVADNLKKGAATNAVQILEALS